MRTFRWIRCLPPALLLIAMLSASAFAGLRDDVAKAVESARLQGGHVAVSIRDCQTGTELVSIDSSEPMIPASNMKLLTTGAALSAFGEGFKFNTKMIRSGDRLVFIGDGDPAFGDPDLLELMQLNGSRGVDIDAFLDLWVQGAVQAGITEVSEVIVDDRIFDRDFVNEGWPRDQLNRRYCAQVAGLNVHLNVMYFYPQRRGGQARPILSERRPSVGWISPSNRATTRSERHDRNSAWIARKIGTNELTFRGNVKQSYLTPVPVTIHDVPTFMAQLLAERLEKAGIRVESYRAASSDDEVFEGETIGPVVQTWIGDAIARCNTESQNLYAECLLKRMGHEFSGEPGSWLNGSAVMRMVIHNRLARPSLAQQIVIKDGSGLSRGNRVTAGVMTAWLDTFHDDSKLGETFLSSLAIPGDVGTLEKRFRNVSLHGMEVRAKSGYINYVSCLSGYVTSPDGRRRSFSILVNDLKVPGTVRVAKDLQEKIVSIIAEELAPKTVGVTP